MKKNVDKNGKMPHNSNMKSIKTKQINITFRGGHSTIPRVYPVYVSEKLKKTLDKWRGHINPLTAIKIILSLHLFPMRDGIWKIEDWEIEDQMNIEINEKSIATSAYIRWILEKYFEGRHNVEEKK